MIPRILKNGVKQMDLNGVKKKFKNSLILDSSSLSNEISDKLTALG